MLQAVAEPAGDSLGQQAYDQLLQLIVTGQLSGGRVLSERQLCQWLGISRSPVRTALSRLEADGLVVRSGPRTLTVRRVTLKDYLDALHVRRQLEPEAARLAAGTIAPATIDRLRAGIAGMLARQDPPSEYHWEIEEGLHAAIAEASGNPLMAEAIARVRNRGRLFDLRRMPGRFEPGCHEHLDILDALARADAAGAQHAMRRHIDAIKANVLDGLART